MNISGQAFDALGALLHLLADPKAYEDQLSVLRKAIDDNKKYVELIAPAGEIMNMLEAQRVKKVEAEKYFAASTAEAKKLVDDAVFQKERILLEAAAKAKEIVAEADALKSAAKAELVSAKEQKAAAAEAKAAAAAHTAAAEALDATRQELRAATDAANQVRVDVETLRSELAAKLDKLRAL